MASGHYWKGTNKIGNTKQKNKQTNKFKQTKKVSVWVCSSLWKWVFCVRKTEPIIIFSDLRGLKIILVNVRALEKRYQSSSHASTLFCYLFPKEEIIWLMLWDFIGNDSKKISYILSSPSIYLLSNKNLSFLLRNT